MLMNFYCPLSVEVGSAAADEECAELTIFAIAKIEHPHWILVCATICKVLFERYANHWKRQLAPWNFCFAEQSHLQAFFAGIEVKNAQLSAEEQIDLIYVRQVEEGVEGTICGQNHGACFFGRLANGALQGGFTTMLFGF